MSPKFGGVDAQLSLQWRGAEKEANFVDSTSVAEILILGSENLGEVAW